MLNDDILGVEVTVQINGTDVREYDAPDAGDEDAKIPTLTKYIECIDNAFFAIRLQVNRDYDWDRRHTPHSLLLHTYVDGQWIKGSILNEVGSTTIKGHEEPRSGTNEWQLRKLQFTSIKMVDDTKKERVEKDGKVAKHLGLIEVTIERGTKHGSSSYNYRHKVAKNKKLELAEKSLKGKAVSHGTSMSTIQHLSTPPNYVKFVGLAQDDGPIAKFRFLYRSQDALRRELIIPRPPTPPSPKFAALTEVDLRRLAKERFEQLRGNLKKENGRPVKREFDEVHNLTSSETPKGRKGKMTRLADGQKVEVIDLSDDDD